MISWFSKSNLKKKIIIKLGLDILNVLGLLFVFAVIVKK